MKTGFSGGKNAQADEAGHTQETRKYRFPRKEKLKGRDEIREVFNRKKGVSCAGAKLFLRPNGLSYNRIAFTFSRKFGNAVERNYSRRLSRESYRMLRANLKQGYDMVLLVYPGHDDLKTRISQMRDLFYRSGFIHSLSIKEDPLS